MVDFDYAGSHGFDDVYKLMRVLRRQCPWDAGQTHESIRAHLLEEACEAMEAVDKNDAELLCEELGDVLLQVVFHTVIAEESGAFRMADVTGALCAKLTDRHPHVFGDTGADGVADVLRNWEAIKRRKKGQATVYEAMRGVAATLPPLMRAEKLLTMAERSGLGALPDGGLREAMDAARAAEDALNEACERYMALCAESARAEGAQ
ncbi:MAG: nucleotide pyrophosphohydrolase [Oscillospiraceae bacterium]|nr:nucleotide pyrophosphohydrolase [Oscillospiraceae bacterium]